MQRGDWILNVFPSEESEEGSLYSFIAGHMDERHVERADNLSRLDAICLGVLQLHKLRQAHEFRNVEP